MSIYGWQCSECGESMLWTAKEAHECDPDKMLARQVANAEKELDDGNVAALLARWGAETSIRLHREFADWLRSHEQEESP